MSRSVPDTTLQNPATRFFDFAGGEGTVQYYDREKKVNINVELPFSFLVLDEVMTVGGGYDDGDNFIGYYSNAIRSRDAKVRPLTVKSSVNGKSRTEMTATWADIKGSLTGAKYIKGLYIAYYNNEKQLEVGYLKMKGAALMPWVELTQHKDIYKGVFSITGKVPKKKGTNDYFAPEFSYSEKLKPETEAKALELDGIVQTYLTAYFAQTIAPNQQSSFPTHAGSAPDDPYADAPEPDLSEPEDDGIPW